MPNARDSQHQVGSLAIARVAAGPRKPVSRIPIHRFPGGVLSKRNPFTSVREQQEIDRAKQTMTDAAIPPVLQSAFDHLQRQLGLLLITYVARELRRAKSRKGDARGAVAPHVGVCGYRIAAGILAEIRPVAAFGAE